MSRQYPNSDKIQPRFAAWLWSIGRDADPAFRQWVGRDWSSDFMQWISASKRRAFQMGMGVRDTALSAYYSEKQLQVFDHDAFTEACWIIADEQRATTVIARPLAAPGLTSYRYRGGYGWIMIGARDVADALSEANRSLTASKARPDYLEVWNGSAYVNVL